MLPLSPLLLAVLVSPLTAAPFTAAPLAVSSAVSDTPTAADLARARLPRPALDSHVVGGSAGAIFAAMNAHLARQPHHTRSCEAHTHAELNALARLLWPRRAAALDQLYAGRGDRRVLRGDIADKERLWAAEAALAAAEPAMYGPGTEHHGVVRDGKCAELVMWWVHHLPAAARTALSAVEGFAVPLLPADGQTADLLHAKNADLGRQNGSAALPPHAAEYVSQVTCTNCHSSGNSSRPAVRPRPKTAGESTGSLAVPAGTCPISASTGKPTVWYEEMSDVGNRKKRCDWDYDPPCQPCEGIGGYSWGDGAGQITFIDCKPIANASSVPAANRTSPVWPLAFQVNEVTTLINQKNTGGRFPGADPCATHNFANDTETLYYDDSRTNYPNGPIMYTKTSSSQIWTLPSADMFIKIYGTFCICVSPHEGGNKSSAPIGPLVHDFAADAVFVGRELVGLEGLGKSVVADHWNKGPHHFWIDVMTNRMVRGWQPWNGLNVYDPSTWMVSPVQKEVFEPSSSCYSGFLHKNISCAAPYAA